MDLSLCIQVVCETESRYSGKCYMEKISTVRMLNGAPVAKDTVLEKSDFKTGDEVVIRFKNKDFRGTVDFRDVRTSSKKEMDFRVPPINQEKWPLPRKSRCSLHDHLGGLGKDIDPGTVTRRYL